MGALLSARASGVRSRAPDALSHARFTRINNSVYYKSASPCVWLNVVLFLFEIVFNLTRKVVESDGSQTDTAVLL